MMLKIEKALNGIERYLFSEGTPISQEDKDVFRAIIKKYMNKTSEQMLDDEYIRIVE